MGKGRLKTFSLHAFGRSSDGSVVCHLVVRDSTIVDLVQVRFTQIVVGIVIALSCGAFFMQVFNLA